MRVPNKNVLLGGLIGMWATVAAVQVSSLPELREAPLTYVSGQHASKAAKLDGTHDVLEIRPIRIGTTHLPSTPKRNIFEAAKPSTSERRVVKAVTPIEAKPSIPVAVVAMPVTPAPPPLPSPEELAEQAASQAQKRKRQQMRETMEQYRYLGYLTRQGEQQAFLGKGQDIYIIHLGDILDGQIQVASITANTVKLLAAQDNIETIIQLKTESSVEPS